MSTFDVMDGLLSLEYLPRNLALKRISEIGFDSFKNTDFVFGYLAATILLDYRDHELIEECCKKNYPVELNKFISGCKKYQDFGSLDEAARSGELATFITDTIVNIDLKYIEGFLSSFLIFIAFITEEMDIGFSVYKAGFPPARE